MKKDPFVYIEDILESINLIENYIKKINFKAFRKDIGIQDKVLRRLEIIGEASSQLTNEFKKGFSDIPWKQIVGLRNIIIHEYSSVSLEQIWHIITQDLASTKSKIEEIKKLHSS